MRRLVGSLLTVALLGLGVLIASPASAATFAVTNLNESGGGSLRQAMLDAQNTPGADTITIGVTGTINLTSGPLLYESADNLTIAGNGVTVSAATMPDVTASGRSPRVFELSGSTGTVTISNMIITGGRAHAIPQTNSIGCNQYIPGNGGGIYSTGTLVLTEVTVTGNRAFTDTLTYRPCIISAGQQVPGPSDVTGPVGGQGGGVWASEFLTITNSTITNNQADERAGGAYTSAQLTVTGSRIQANIAGDSGGGLYSEGTVTTVRTTVNANVAGNAGGGILSAANMSIAESTISNNTAGRFAGGVTGTGTGEIRNSTIASNHSGLDGEAASGYGGGVAILGNGTFSIRYSTIARNEALGDGANISGQQGVGATVSWVIEGTVLSDPTGTSDNCDITNVTASYSYAFGNNAGGCFPTGGVGTNAAGGSPGLGALAANGGGTDTMMPGAPLQGQIPAAACTVGVDQRNRVRPFDNFCDIGAVEDNSGENAGLGNGGGTVDGVCSEFNAINPVRVLDTREAAGVTRTVDNSGQPLGVGRIGPSGIISVSVTSVPGNGDAGVPSSGVGAVVLNVTSTGATSPSFVTVWPTGSDRPLASNLNSEPGTDVPNATIAKVGTGGRVSLFNNAGNVHLIADVVGWYAECGRYRPIIPTRVLDTRSGVGAPAAIVSSGGQLSVTVTGIPGANGSPGVPVAGQVSAVVLNVTATESTSPSFVTVWPTGEDQPLASNINTEPGQDVPNLVIAKVGNQGRVNLFNNAGSTHLVADVLGYFTFDSTFVALNPTRALDTRSGLGATGPVGGQQSRDLRVLGVGAVPTTGVAAVVINVTATESSVPSFVTVWPTGATRPNASSLNTEPGVDVPNLVIAKVGAGGNISLYNNAGTVHLVGDILGYFPVPAA